MTRGEWPWGDVDLFVWTIPSPSRKKPKRRVWMCRAVDIETGVSGFGRSQSARKAIDTGIMWARRRAYQRELQVDKFMDVFEMTWEEANVTAEPIRRRRESDESEGGFPGGVDRCVGVR